MSPAAYPTAVVKTPGVSQNAFSAPQKQPSPKIAVCMPAGNGGVSGRPLTWWVAGTGIRSARPGSAVSVVGIVVLCEPHMVVTSGLIVTSCVSRSDLVS